MAESFSINIAVNSTEVRDALNRALQATGNLTPAMKAIGERLLRSTEENFKSEQAPDGTAWPKSAAAIAANRKTLSASHQLRNSIWYRAGKDEVRLGTPKPYAAIHQLGFDGPMGVGAHTRKMTHIFGRKLKSPVPVLVRAHIRQVNLPARPFLGVGTGDEREIIDILEEHIDNAFRGAT